MRGGCAVLVLWLSCGCVVLVLWLCRACAVAVRGCAVGLCCGRAVGVLRLCCGARVPLEVCFGVQHTGTGAVWSGQWLHRVSVARGYTRRNSWVIGYTARLRKSVPGTNSTSSSRTTAAVDSRTQGWQREAMHCRARRWKTAFATCRAQPHISWRASCVINPSATS